VKSGALVAHRITSRIVRVVHGAVHLLRQRGRGKMWTGYIPGRGEVSLRTSDAAEAQRRLDALAAERGGAEGGAAPSPTAKLSELGLLFAEFCKPPRHTAKTAEKYNASALRFIAWAEGNKIITTDQVTVPILFAFVKQRSSGRCGPAMVNRDLSGISALFRFAISHGHIAESPFDLPGARRLRLKEPRPKPNALTLSPDQIDTFLAKADEVSHPAYAALFRVTAGSAMRIDEARHIDLANLNDETGYLTVTPKKEWTTKSYRYRDVPVSKATLTAARAFIAARHLVPLDNKSTWDEIRRVRRKLEGIPHFSMHDLRRAWASAMHANGASLKAVSVFLGHSSVQVTERYIRVFQTTGGHEFLPR